jgi:sigma-E factor negative regulatory protein RseC
MNTMNDPQGTVLDLLHESDGERAIIEVDAEAACPRCAEGRGCGAGIFSGATGSRRLEARIPRGLHVAAGDVVRVSLAPESMLRAAMIVYGLPLAGAASGALAAYQLELGDVGAAALALAGLGAGLWVARLRLRRKECLARFTPTIVGRVAAGGQHP